MTSNFAPSYPPQGAILIIIVMIRRYGYIFGVLLALEDTHRDEVFLEPSGHILARNGIQECSYSELVAIARELGVNPWRLTLIDYEEMTDDGV